LENLNCQPSFVTCIFISILCANQFGLSGNKIARFGPAVYLTEKEGLEGIENFRMLLAKCETTDISI
jgi:hypothetical protein